MKTTLTVTTQLKSTTGSLDSNCLRWDETKTFEKGTQFELLKNTLDCWTLKCKEGKTWTCHRNRLTN